MEERERIDKSLLDLIGIIHFAEKVSAKIHGLLDEAEIYWTVKEEFRKSKRYDASILLLTDDETKLSISETSLALRKLKAGEKASGLRLKGYKIDLNKSRIYSQVVMEGKTVQANANDIIGEWVPRPLVQLISKIIGYENKPAVLTPLKKHGKIVGVLAMSSTSLAEHFIPSVKNLAQHISNALELAGEYAVRKRVEEALKESQEKLKAQYKGIPIPTYTWQRAGEDFVLVNYNDAAMEITHGNVASYVGKKASEMYRDRTKILEELSRSFTEKTTIKRSMLYQFMSTSECKHLEVSYAFVPPDLVVVHTEDITERKKAEDTLKKGEQKLRDIIDSSSDAIVWVDTTGKVTMVNKKGLDVTGFSEKELLGKSFMDVEALTQESKERILEGFMKRLQGINEPPYEVEIVTKNGEILPFELGASIMREGGKIVGIQAIFRDLSERKKMEEKLRQYSEHLEELVQKRTEELSESEKRYSVLVEEASDGVTIIQDGKVVFINKRGAEIIGYPKEELLGLPFERVVDERIREQTKKLYVRRMHGGKVPAAHEITLIAKNGERVPVEVSGTLVNYQGRPADLAIVRDIRERKRMEEERLKLEKLAAVGEVATMVGHDLRNPLQSIEIATYYLNSELPNLCSSTSISRKVEEMLKVINDSVSYADKIVRDLRDFSAPRKLKLEEASLNTIVKEALSQIEVPENVKLITKLSNLPETEVDKDMLERVFTNLALNGIQAMTKGGTLKVSTIKTKGFVEARVKDTGIGILKGDMTKIFTPFFTRKAKGMGMGLAICRRFVDSHGGSIEVESEEGKGSTFTVKLPISKENGGDN